MIRRLLRAQAQSAAAPVLTRPAHGIEDEHRTQTPPDPDVALPASSRRLRFHLGVLGIVGAVLLALLARPTRSHAEAALPSDRGRLVDQAASLLDRARWSEPGREADRQSGFAIAAKNGTADTSSAASDQSADATSPRVILPPLRDFAVRNARPDLRELVRLTAEERAAFDLPGSRPELPAPAGNRPKPKKASGAIPESIEGSRPRHDSEDALESLSVRASLRTIDSDNAPYVLQALREGANVVQAQLLQRNPNGSLTALPGWFSSGDSPAPGWRLLTVDKREAILLTPVGNILRLGPPDSGSTAATVAGPRATGGDNVTRE